MDMQNVAFMILTNAVHSPSLVETLARSSCTIDWHQERIRTGV